MPRAAFLEAIGSGWNVFPQSAFVTARTTWKYGASLGVYGTPTFVANGNFSDHLSEWALGDWETWLANALSGAGTPVPSPVLATALTNGCSGPPELVGLVAFLYALGAMSGYL